MKFRLNYVLFLALFCLMLSSCAGTGSVASRTKNTTDQSVLKLAKSVVPASSFVNGAVIVGKELKYQMGKVDRISNEVSFRKQDKTATISVRLILLQSDDQTIEIFVTVNGISGEESQTITAKVIDNFKTGLEKQFANR